MATKVISLVFHVFVFILVCLCTLLLKIHGMPPQSPIMCQDNVCTLQNSYGVWSDRKECPVQNVTYPKTEQELLSIVAYANQNKLNLKVVSKFSHSMPRLACPGTQSSSSILISTANYDSGIDVDVKNMVVTVDAGVPMRRLIDTVEEAGLSLVAAPYWEGVSVGGLISTGVHGSSWWGKGGAVHDHVVGLSLVLPANESEGYANIIKLESQDPLLDAAKVSLGLLGVISKVKLSLEKGFKRSITFNFTEDGHVEDIFMDHANKHEFADITWYPSRHVAVYRYDNRVPLNTPGDGVYDFLGFQSIPLVISKSVRLSEKSSEEANDVKGKCALASSGVGLKKLYANGLKNTFKFTGYPVIGRQGKMQSSGSCLYSPPSSNDACVWDPRANGLFFYESSAIFSASKFGKFIRDVKKLRDINPENFCGVDLYNGFLIRFMKASTAYLGQPEDSVAVDFNYYRSMDPSIPRLNQDVWEEVEQMAFFKYGARPHWAKNRNVAFLGVQKKYPNISKFTAAKKRLDPQNIFSNDWLDEMLYGSEKESARVDGCALEGQCICSEDRHCSPKRGYFCKRGLVYNEARVCRYLTSSGA